MDDVKIKVGEKFDRYSGALKNYDGQGVPNLGGNFTSPMPNGISFSFGQRALNQPENVYDFYYEIEVIRDLPFMAQTGDVIPWFNQAGGGQQAILFSKWFSGFCRIENGPCLSRISYRGMEDLKFKRE